MLSPSALTRLPAVAKEPAGATFSLVLFKRRGTIWRAAKSRNYRSEHGIRVAICDQRTSREIAPCASAFLFSNGRNVIRSARRSSIYSLADDRLFRTEIDFPLVHVTSTVLRCSSKASLRLRRAQDRACRKLPDCNNLSFGCFSVVSHKLTPTSQTRCGGDQRMTKEHAQFSTCSRRLDFDRL